jgi:hypothetical protein
MTLHLELPADVEARLTVEAQRHTGTCPLQTTP